MYGINVSTPQVVLTIMANIELAARKAFGREFRPALQNILTKYTYSHTHDYVLLKEILQELAKANLVCTLKDAPTPSAVNAVTTILEKMHITNNYDSSKDDDYTESSLGASSDDNESMAATSTCGRRRKGNNKGKTTNKIENDDDGKKEKNGCPHCKKLGR